MREDFRGIEHLQFYGRVSKKVNQSTESEHSMSADIVQPTSCESDSSQTLAPPTHTTYRFGALTTDTLPRDTILGVYIHNNICSKKKYSKWSFEELRLQFGKDALNIEPQERIQIPHSFDRFSTFVPDPDILRIYVEMLEKAHTPKFESSPSKHLSNNFVLLIPQINGIMDVSLNG